MQVLPLEFTAKGALKIRHLLFIACLFSPGNYGFYWPFCNNLQDQIMFSVQVSLILN